MPQFADFIRHTLRTTTARRDINSFNNPNYINNNSFSHSEYNVSYPEYGYDYDYSPPDNGRLEAGVIVAIAVLGVAILACIYTCIVKQRKRQQKRAAKRNNAEMNWPGWGIDERGMANSSTEMIGVALGGEERNGRVKKVAFAIDEVDRAPPPSYEVVVNSERHAAAAPAVVVTSPVVDQ